MVGVSPCHLKDFEMGSGKESKSIPRLHVAYAIANALGVSVYDVFPNNDGNRVVLKEQ